MNRDRVDELHYIAAIGNVPSIIQHGILCHREAQKLPHHSVAMAAVQEIRHAKPVPPGTGTIHDYANLYFHARNPMMFTRKQHHQALCVLRVRNEVLDLPGVMVVDQNAASNYARFYGSPAGLAALDETTIYAVDWKDPDQIEYWRRKSARCAEVLIPDRVAPAFILGVYVSGAVGSAALAAVAPTLATTLNPSLFFQE